MQLFFVCLQMLFGLLLWHFGEVTHRSSIPHRLLDGMTRHLYDLTQISPQHAGHCVAKLTASRYKEFATEKEECHGKPRYPDFDLVCLFGYSSYLSVTCLCDIAVMLKNVNLV